jgi:MoaA/NifB/PqqE/SkfB family radical SAM enzyme
MELSDLFDSIETGYSFPLFSTDFSISPAKYLNHEREIGALKQMGLVPKRLIAPLFVLFDITSKCNMGCAYCYNKSGCGTNVSMDRETLFDIAKELVKLKVFSVCVCGGEPSLHPDFLDLISYLYKSGIIVSSISNGLCVDDDTVKGMAENLALVQVTLDGPNSEYHDELRGKGSFDKAMDTIERLKKNKVNQLRIAFTCTKANANSFSKMIDLCLKVGANDLRTMPLVPVGRAYSNRDLLPSPEQLRLVENQIKQWNRDASLTSKVSVEWGLPHNHIQMGLLYGYMTGVNISAEGYYKMTPYLPVAFGNAYKVTLEAAWKLGLGSGWLILGAKQIFESIKKIEDFSHAYDKVVKDDHFQEGFLDYFPEVLYGR